MKANHENTKYIDLKNQRKKLSEVIPLKMPFTLFVDPTNWCNFKCSFCPRNFDDFSTYAGEFQHMDMILFEKIMKDLKKCDGRLKVLRLFYLGEPFLCPDFLRMLQMAIEYDIAERIEISSNASLLNLKIAQTILDLAKIYSGIIYLRFSIYSIISEKNKEITKSPITVENICENVSTLKQLRDTQKVTNVVTYAKMLNTFDNENEMFIDLYKNIVDEVEIEQPMNWSGYDNRNLLNTYNEEQIASIRKENLPKVCAYPFHTLAIQSNGDVVCCCVDWSRKTCVGNVKDESLLQIWHGERLKKLRVLHLEGKRFLNDACKNCNKLPSGKSYKLDNLDDVLPEVLD